MKAKRIVVTMLLALGCILSLAITAFATPAEGEITKDQVTLKGYVSGVNMPLFIADKIYYNASISGANVPNLATPAAAGGDSNKVYITPYTDKSSLGKIYLWADKRSVMNNNGVGCGVGSEKAYLKMWCLGSTKTLESNLV